MQHALWLAAGFPRHCHPSLLHSETFPGVLKQGVLEPSRVALPGAGARPAPGQGEVMAGRERGKLMARRERGEVMAGRESGELTSLLQADCPHREAAGAGDQAQVLYLPPPLLPPFPARCRGQGRGRAGPGRGSRGRPRRWPGGCRKPRVSWPGEVTLAPSLGAQG